jgi:hypothetical protein
MPTMQSDEPGTRRPSTTQRAAVVDSNYVELMRRPTADTRRAQVETANVESEQRTAMPNTRRQPVAPVDAGNVATEQRAMPDAVRTTHINQVSYHNYPTRRTYNTADGSTFTPTIKPYYHYSRQTTTTGAPVSGV